MVHVVANMKKNKNSVIKNVNSYVYSLTWNSAMIISTQSRRISAYL
jgi:hypothetical protein